MSAFLDWFFAFMTTMINGLWKILSGIGSGIFQIFNLPAYIAQLNTFKNGFSVVDWILAVISLLAVAAIWIILITLLVLGIRKYIRFRTSMVGKEDLLEELAKLHTDVLKMTQERERILGLKAGTDLSSVDDLNDLLNPDAAHGEEEEEEQPEENTVLQPVRFARLASIDQLYADYVRPEYEEDYTLEQLCDNFRNFACSRMGLFYEKKVVRLMFAGMASTKLVLLQGISGTGKTSLPYAMGKFFTKDSTIVSVQPSWRDRTELFGYFNEFSKKFNETELLRRIYAASYNDDMNMVILDEMNIARVEYYFAEMLSVMEMPQADEWQIELVPSSWDSDPANLIEGRLLIPQNVWYIGTANNDDSTFAVSDKVYDRALTINIDTKGVAFEAPDTPPSNISYTSLHQKYEQAIQDNPIDQEYMDKIETLDNYVIKKFRVAFGNRIVKQMKIFVPVYVACGGEAYEAIDHILCTKVFRKFESLNMALIRDELKGLINYLNNLFGKDKMKDSIEFLDRLYRSY